MTKQLIGTLVGGLILFFWQFLSWGPLSVHGSEMQYHPQQEEILAAINKFDLEEGMYFLPSVPQDQMANRDALMEKHLGKPWVRLSYKENLDMSMGMNLVRGLIIDLASAFLLTWLLMKFENRDFITCVMAALAVGAIGYMTIPYLNTIWFKGPSMGYLVDAVVQWGLVGAFLGWWLNRK